MMILGRDFMTWYDSWSNGDYYWETPDFIEETMTGAGDRLHDVQGEWRLDPDQEYDLDWLGQIRPNELSNDEIDTHRTLTVWLARRGRVAQIYRVGKEHAKTLEKRMGKLGQVLKAKPVAGQIRGLDFMDWYDHAMNDGFYVEENAVVLHDQETDTWLLDPEAFYDSDDLGALVPDGPSSDEDHPDIDTTVRSYIRTRTVVPVLILATPENHGKIVDASLDLLVPDEEEPSPEPGPASRPQSAPCP